LIRSEAYGVEILPAGTAVNVRTTQAVAAESSEAGMHVAAVVDDPVTNGAGEVVIPRGASAILEIVRTEESSNMKGRDRVFFKVLSLHVNGRTYAVSTNQVEVKGPSEGKRATRKIVGGGGIGAAVGGIFGGGTGAAIGAIAGGTTGAVVAGSGKTRLNVPAETRMHFRLAASVQM